MLDVWFSNDPKFVFSSDVSTPEALPNHAAATQRGAPRGHTMSLLVSQQPLYKPSMTLETRGNCERTIAPFPQDTEVRGQACPQTSCLSPHH